MHLSPSFRILSLPVLLRALSSGPLLPQGVPPLAAP